MVEHAPSLIQLVRIIPQGSCAFNPVQAGFFPLGLPLSRYGNAIGLRFNGAIMESSALCHLTGKPAHITVPIIVNVQLCLSSVGT
jgi:hypothetical protein